MATVTNAKTSSTGAKPATGRTAKHPPALDTTKVTRWLQDRFAAGFAEAFYKEGYLEVDEVDAAAVDRLVTEKGTASRLKADLARRAQGAMVPPDLPAGTTLDLSKPEVMSADGITFKIPTALSVERTQDVIQSPNALQNADWVVIARNSALLYGFRMDGPGPARARHPVLEWVVPERIDFARSEMFQARVESAVTYTADTAAYVRAGFDKQTATAGFPFCAASFERSHKERTASSSSHKELHEIGMWKYPRATLFLDDCTRVSAAFTRAVREALEGAHDPKEALKQVLVDYGHAVPMEVTLGGQLHFEHVRVEGGTTNQHEVQQEIKAAVEAKYQGFSASAGYASGTSSSHSEASTALAEQTSFDALGGDATLVSNPAQWAPTVKDPRLWAVIGNSRLCSPLDLLPADLRSAALQVWPPPSYPELPAVEEPLEVPRDTVSQATTGGFLLGMRDCAVDGRVGQRGTVIIASGRHDREHAQDGGFLGEADVHAYRPNDLWFDVSGLCLPVAAYSDYGAWVESTASPGGEPRIRLGFARARLDFGEWVPLSLGAPETLDADGFVAVSITTKDGVWGHVTVASGQTTITAASADSGALMPSAATCVPVRAGATVTVTAAAFDPAGRPYAGPADAFEVRARRIPLGEGWSMGSAEEVEPNTHLTAQTDGVLHALLDAAGDAPRGFVRLYSASDDPWAGASVHTYSPHHRRVGLASAMLPVGKGSPYFASFTPTSGAPRLRLTWTPIVHDAG